MAKHAFEKFINKEPKGAKKKELIKQQKRKQKAKTKFAGEESRRRKFEKQAPRFESRNSKPEIKNVSHTENKSTSDNRYKTESRNTKTEIQNVSRNQNNQTSNIRHKTENRKPETPNFQPKILNVQQQTSGTIMPLNKFIAHAGVCGRREAVELIKQELVTVNHKKILEPGFKISLNDKVHVNGKQVFLQKHLVYILLNKPKDYITTADDPQKRKTVFDIIKHATTERVFSVGRLDRNTTGVLLLTNDGELTQKLTHPSYEVKKIYEITLDKALSKKDFDAVLKGIELEDGIIFADALAYSDERDKSRIGIEIHSGRNRIVRRIFEHLGYDVKNLDRVMFANLTKKNVERGKYRFLNEKEIRLLKYMNQSFVRATK